MMYTLIISLLIEKPFYLLRPESFSFQIVSEFIYIFVKFSNFMSGGGGAFDSLFCPEGRVFVHSDCPGGAFLLPSSRVPGVCPGGGMVLDEIDTCINWIQFNSLLCSITIVRPSPKSKVMFLIGITLHNQKIQRPALR